MKIQYELTQRDLDSIADEQREVCIASRRSESHNPVDYLLFAFLAFVFIPKWSQVPAIAYLVFLPSLLCFIFISSTRSLGPLGMLVFRHYLFTEAWLRRRFGNPGLREIEVSSAGGVYRYDSREMKFWWGADTTCSRNDQYIFLYFESTATLLDSSVSVAVIPKAAFPDTDAFDAFVELLAVKSGEYPFWRANDESTSARST